MYMTPDETKLFFTLYHGRSYNEIEQDIRNKKRRNRKTYPFRQDYFQEQTLMIKLTGFGLKRTDENLFKNNYSMLNLHQLSFTTDSLSKQLEQRRKLFHNTLLNSQYFIFTLSFEKLHENDTTGTLAAKADSAGFDLWTAFYKLSFSEKQSIIDQATAYANSASKYIQNNNKAFKSRIKYIRRHQIEWHRKFTLSLACVIFFFIGAPLGAIIRRGGLGMPIVISVVFFVFYYIISMSGEKFVREDVWSPFTGMWISTFILLPIGAFLTYKSTTDSAIMSSETYSQMFKRSFEKLRILWLRKHRNKKSYR